MSLEKLKSVFSDIKKDFSQSDSLHGPPHPEDHSQLDIDGSPQFKKTSITTLSSQLSKTTLFRNTNLISPNFDSDLDETTPFRNTNLISPNFDSDLDDTGKMTQTSLNDMRSTFQRTRDYNPVSADELFSMNSIYDLIPDMVPGPPDNGFNGETNPSADGISPPIGSTEPTGVTALYWDSDIPQSYDTMLIPSPFFVFQGGSHPIGSHPFETSEFDPRVSKNTQMPIPFKNGYNGTILRPLLENIEEITRWNVGGFVKTDFSTAGVGGDGFLGSPYTPLSELGLDLSMSQGWESLYNRDHSPKELNPDLNTPFKPYTYPNSNRANLNIRSTVGSEYGNIFAPSRTTQMAAVDGFRWGVNVEDMLDQVKSIFVNPISDVIRGKHKTLNSQNEPYIVSQLPTSADDQSGGRYKNKGTRDLPVDRSKTDFKRITKFLGSEAGLAFTIKQNFQQQLPSRHYKDGDQVIDGKVIHQSGKLRWVGQRFGRLYNPFSTLLAISPLARSLGHTPNMLFKKHKFFDITTTLFGLDDYLEYGKNSTSVGDASIKGALISPKVPGKYSLSKIYTKADPGKDPNDTIGAGTPGILPSGDPDPAFVAAKKAKWFDWTFGKKAKYGEDKILQQPFTIHDTFQGGNLSYIDNDNVWKAFTERLKRFASVDQGTTPSNYGSGDKATLADFLDLDSVDGRIGFDSTGMVSVNKAGDTLAPDDPNNTEKRITSIVNYSINQEKDGLPFYFIDTRDFRVIFFRAYLSSLTEDIQPQWEVSVNNNKAKYKFIGTERLITFTLKLVAQTKDELEMMYKKMNRLSSFSYSEYGKKEWPKIRMRLGDYFDSGDPDSQSGIEGHLESVNYVVPDSSPWETEVGKRVPKQIDATIAFRAHPEEENQGIYRGGKRSQGYAKMYGFTGTDSLNKIAQTQQSNNQ